LYKEDPQVLLDKYYPVGGHDAREMVDEAKGKITDNESKIKFIEDYFVKPISYLFLAIMTDQAKKWEKDLKGQRPPKLKELIKKEKWDNEYFIFTDRDFRRLFELCKKEGLDPVIRFKLNQHMGVETDKLGIKRLQSNQEAVEYLIRDLRKWLKGRQKEEGLIQPTFPVKLEKIVDSKAVKAIIVVSGIAIFVLTHGFFGIKGGIFVALVTAFLLHQFVQLLPFLKFHFYDWFRAIFKIWNSRKNYKEGLLTPEQIKIKKHFFRTYFTYLGLYILFITGVCIYYGYGVIPWFGWALGGIPILLMSAREAIRSW